MAVNSLSPWFFRFVPINPCGEVGEIHFSPREQSPAPLMSAPRDCRLTPCLFWRLTRRSSNDPHHPERAVLSPSLHLRQTSFREAGPVPDATQHAGMLAAPVRSVRAVCAGGLCGRRAEALPSPRRASGPGGVHGGHPPPGLPCCCHQAHLLGDPNSGRLSSFHSVPPAAQTRPLPRPLPDAHT